MNFITEEWQCLMNQSTRGQKSWFTKLKNHYIKLVQEHPEEAAVLLALHELHCRIIQK